MCCKQRKYGVKDIHVKKDLKMLIDQREAKKKSDKPIFKKYFKGPRIGNNIEKTTTD